MTLTNRANLPEPFVVAFGIDDYERGNAVLTTTEMPLPPRILSYRKKYWDDMVEDVSDRVWAFAGQTKHIVLERIARSNPERYIAEQRFECVMPGGKKVSGKIDLYDKETRIQYRLEGNERLEIYPWRHGRMDCARQRQPLPDAAKQHQPRATD